MMLSAEYVVVLVVRLTWGWLSPQCGVDVDGIDQGNTSSNNQMMSSTTVRIFLPITRQTGNGIICQVQ